MNYYVVPVSASMVYYDNTNVATNNVYINLTVDPLAADNEQPVA